MDQRLSDRVGAERTETPPPPIAMPGADDSIDVGEIVRKLWRRRGLILGTVVALCVLTAIVLFQIAPRYTAQTLVLIETRGANVVDLEAVVSGLSADAETIESEMQIIGSRQLVEKVIDREGIDTLPEFNRALRPPGLLASWLDPDAILPEGWRETLFPNAEPPTAETIALQERVRVVESFLERLDIAPKGRSRVIGISFTSEDPALAATVANALAEFYILEQLEAKFEATRRATEWLNERISGLRSQVEASERAVEEFRRKSGLLRGTEGTLISQEISELNTQLILARTGRAEAEARLKQVRELIRSSGGAASAAEVLESQLIQRLREQEAEVNRKVAELSEEFGERHPRMINARAELRDLRDKIAAEVTKIVNGLENEVGVAKAREASLRRSVNQLKARLGQSNNAEVQLRALTREANANRTLLETFLSRFKETSEQEDLDVQQPDARVISRANMPVEPSYPRKKLILAVVFVGATFLGVALVFLVEQLDRGFRSGEQIERAVGVGALSLVPALTGAAKRQAPPERYILERPNSAFGESIRTLHTSLLLSHVDAPPKTVVVTSSQPAEGKSTLILALGRMLAKAGRKVIIIDCDLRKPGIGVRLNLPTEPGLVELLAGDIPLEEAVRKDEESGAHVLTAGRAVPNTADIVGSEHMKRLLAGFAQNYDLVLLDSAPVLAVADARILSNIVDATVFAVRWADTPREVVVQGLRQVLSSGGRLAGVALTLVDVKRHAQYGYGDSTYYYGRIKKYYVD